MPKLVNGTLRGFTLIELLITISIIGLVFGVVISSASIIQKNARDAKRQSDLGNIQSALQHYYADQNFYPDSTFNLSTDTNLTSSDGNPVLIGASKTYIATLPKEPSTGRPNYCYLPQTISGVVCDNGSVDPSARCHKYTLFALLEASGGTGSCGSTATYNYQIGSL